MRQLLSLDFCGHLPIFIRHLLINHTFRVRIGNTLSSSFDQIEDVHQARALSVLCFALAISNIVTAVPNGISCSLYADDFVLLLLLRSNPSRQPSKVLYRGASGEEERHENTK